MGQLDILIWLLVAPLLLVDLVFLLEMALGLARPSAKQLAPVNQRIQIVVPAHNEAAGIANTLTCLKQATGSGFEILVVADNCTDNTASIVRDLGIQVVERNDTQFRGKGYALAFARDGLRHAPPAAVIVLDADCRTDEASLRNLASACLSENRPAQAINLLKPDRTAAPLVQISTFAFLIKNLVRQRGLQRISGGVHLTGTGMCLPWRLFEQADLATSNIVEDIRLGIELAHRDAPPQLVMNGIVWSDHAELSQTITQRSRWEGGFLSLARTMASATIGRGIQQMRLRTVFSGLDLLVPPLALLAILNFGAILLTAALVAVGWSSPVPTIVLALFGILMCGALVAAWQREGRDYLSGAALLRLPFYAIWKVPMYLRFLRWGAPTEWVRTTRPDGKDREA